MAKKPLLEEVSDSEIDNMDLDIAQFDPSLKTPFAPLPQGPQITRSQDQEPPLFPNFPPEKTEQRPAHQDVVDPNKFSAEEREELRKFQIIYPCYFDKARSHKDGRRVSESRAVTNPIAKTISDACRHYKLPVLLELDKTHPQDFGNPGRVRVLIKDTAKGGELTDSRFKSKRAVLNTIADYLKTHPTTLKSIGPSSGIPLPQEYETGFEPCEVPKVKGFKMNTIVPVHSNLTIKHPMTKSIYDPIPEQSQVKAPQAPKQPKKKVMKIRG